MATKLIKCFVAMAFGEDDCDAIYDNQIHHTLKSLNISPIRVDRKEPKDDLNVYIIRMLKESDFALADLTYARPSVYYEAGFAERKIPVVYTSRKDHLSRSQEDECLRVHFDLEMKKIIAWSDPDDITFSKRLKKRINYAIRLIKQQKKEDELLKKDQQAFSTLSIKSRINKIGAEFQCKLKAKRYWTESLVQLNIRVVRHLLPLEVLIGAKMINKTCHLCVVLVTDSITKNEILKTLARINGAVLVSSDQNIDLFEEKYYFCSLRRVPASRFLSVLPNAKPLKAPGSFYLRSKYDSRLEITRKIYIRSISPIESALSMKEIIEECVSTLPDEKTNRNTSLSAYRSGGISDGYKISFSKKPTPKKTK